MTNERSYATKTDRAYWALREAIVTGEIDEGSPLDDNELKAKLEVGRTPIREAIKRLTLEEFVVWPRHRTPYVRTTGASDLAQLYEARQIFEVPAARMAAERATEAEIIELDRHCDLFDAAVTGKKMYEVAEHDYNFHLALAKASRNRFLVDAVGHLNCGSLRLWYHGFIKLGIGRINDDHRLIAERIGKGDAEGVSQAVRDHIEFSHERQLTLYGLTAPRTQSDDGRAAAARITPGRTP